MAGGTPLLPPKKQLAALNADTSVAPRSCGWDLQVAVKVAAEKDVRDFGGVETSILG